MPTVAADVIAVQSSPWPETVRSQGSLFADEVAVVGSKVAGRVDEVHVDLGDFVKQDSPLIALDESEFNLQVQQAEAQLAQARSAVGLMPDDPVEKLDPKSAPPVRETEAQWGDAKDKLARAEGLLLREAVTAAEVEQLKATERVAQARYASALNGVYEKIAQIGVRQAELSLARQRLKDVVIRMPFDGLVQQRETAPGAFIQVGDPVATVVRTNPLRFRGTLPERYAQKLAAGQEVTLKIESVEEPVHVEITRISPALNRLNRSLLFEAAVKNPDLKLRGGLFGEADIVIDADAESLVVPRSSVVEFAGAEKVWKVVDGKSVEQAVLTGERRGDRIEIIDGLQAGDVILVDGTQGRPANVTANPVDPLRKSGSAADGPPATAGNGPSPETTSAE